MVVVKILISTFIYYTIFVIFLISQWWNCSLFSLHLPLWRWNKNWQKFYEFLTLARSSKAHLIVGLGERTALLCVLGVRRISCRSPNKMCVKKSILLTHSPLSSHEEWFSGVECVCKRGKESETFFRAFYSNQDPRWEWEIMFLFLPLFLFFSPLSYLL